MKITFKYDLDKDVWCLLNKGKSSINSSNPTKVYTELKNKFGNNPTKENTEIFIKGFINKNNIDIDNTIKIFQEDWDNISYEFQKRSEKIFGVSLLEDITAYLTINNRCPYNINEGYFFVSVPDNSHMKKMVMHELWHFYTWYKFGIKWENKIGKDKYNDIKESLTVLLNIEFSDLLPEGITDTGYPQHKELRERILNLWKETKKIENVWQKINID